PGSPDGPPRSSSTGRTIASCGHSTGTWARKTSCTCLSTSGPEALCMPSERLVLRSPEAGHKILIAESGLRVPDDPIIPLIEGDGIGPDVVRAARSAIDAAVDGALGGRRRIDWYPGAAGGRAMLRDGP